jgi:hypothetical protein
MNILLSLCLLLGWASSAWAMEHYTEELQDQSGKAIQLATVRVYNAGTLTLATIYSDNGVTHKTNPFLTGTDGAFDFYAANGRYDLTFTKSGYTFTAAHTAGIALFDLVDYVSSSVNTFSSLTSSTNTTAAMVCGTGCSLSTSGSGTITATGVTANAVALATGTTGNYVSGATTSQGLLRTGTEDASLGLIACANGEILKNVSGTSWGCSADSTGGSPTFDTVGSGTNTTASMECGSGCTINSSGTGTITATGVTNNAVVLTTGTSGNYVASATASQGLLMTGTEGGSLGLKVCSNNEILKNVGGASWDCAADSTGGTPSFDTIASGTNTTFAAIIGSGGSLVVSGTGINASNVFYPNVTTVNAGNSPYTAVHPNLSILCDTATGARTVNLPAATTKNAFFVKNIGVNTCTVNRAGSDTIDGTTSAAIETQYGSILLIPDGTSAWYIF